MKKVFAILAIAGLMAACNNSGKKEETKTDTTKTDTTVVTPPADTTKPATDTTKMDTTATKM